MAKQRPDQGAPTAEPPVGVLLLVHLVVRAYLPPMRDCTPPGAASLTCHVPRTGRPLVCSTGRARRPRAHRSRPLRIAGGDLLLARASAGPHHLGGGLPVERRARGTRRAPQASAVDQHRIPTCSVPTPRWSTRSPSSSPSCSTPGPSSRTSRCGTPTSWAARPIWATCSRPSSPRSASPPTSCPSGGRSASSPFMKVVVAAMGTFLLARALKMRFAGAFLAGVVFGFGLFLMAWIPWPLANVFPLIPWMLLATERLVRRPDALSVVALAVLVGLQLLGGHPESSVHARSSPRWASSSCGLSSAPARRDGRRAGAQESDVALAAVVGRSLRRPAFVVRRGARARHGAGRDSPRPLPRAAPQLLGPHGASPWRCPRPAKVRLAAFLPGYFPGTFDIETAFYAGALPLMMALVALLRARLERIAIAAVRGPDRPRGTRGSSPSSGSCNGCRVSTSPTTAGSRSSISCAWRCWRAGGSTTWRRGSRGAGELWGPASWRGDCSCSRSSWYSGPVRPRCAGSAVR